MNKFILINVIFYNLLFSTEGCTDIMAFNCIDDEDYHSYIINAGGIYTDEPAVIDDNIVTTAHYKDMGPWMREVLKKINT